MPPARWRLRAHLHHPVYDCFYLAVSEALDAPLVTADGRLLARVAGTSFSTRTQGRRDRISHSK